MTKYMSCDNKLTQCRSTGDKCATQAECLLVKGFITKVNAS